MMEECYRIKVLVSAELIGNPLSVLFAVIKIKHTCHCIYTDSINMEFPEPEKDIGYKEIADFRFCIIKDLCSPVGMFPKSGIRMLVNALSVKRRKSMGIRGKMRRNPVKDYSDSVFVEFINKIHEILRRSVS